jgi:hypothetical protein
MEEPTTFLPPGTRVVLRGLVKGSAMNGRHATVVRTLARSSDAAGADTPLRVEVKVPSPHDPTHPSAPIEWRRFSVKRANLRLAPVVRSPELLTPDEGADGAAALPELHIGMKAVTCPLCGDKLQARSEEECAAHMQDCRAFKKLYPNGEQGFTGSEQAGVILRDLGVL